MHVLIHTGIVMLALAQSAPASSPFIGYWIGSMPGGAPLRLLVRVELDPDGQPRAALTSLDQSPAERVADKTTIQNGELRLQFAAIGASFRGRLDGKSKLTGEFVQGGRTFRFILERTDGPPKARRRPQVPVKPYPYNEEDVTLANKKAAIHVRRDAHPAPDTWPTPRRRARFRFGSAGSGRDGLRAQTVPRDRRRAHAARHRCPAG